MKILMDRDGSRRVVRTRASSASAFAREAAKSWLDDLQRTTGFNKPLLVGLLCVPVFGWLVVLAGVVYQEESTLARRRQLMHEALERNPHLTTAQRLLMHRAIGTCDDAEELSRYLRDVKLWELPKNAVVSEAAMIRGGARVYERGIYPLHPDDQ